MKKTGLKYSKQPTIEINYDESEHCDKCGKEGAMDFAGELLCLDCVCKDVFEDYNDVN